MLKKFTIKSDQIHQNLHCAAAVICIVICVWGLKSLF